MTDETWLPESCPKCGFVCDPKKKLLGFKLPENTRAFDCEVCSYSWSTEMKSENNKVSSTQRSNSAALTKEVISS